MAEDITYQINGQLADNTVTPDNTEDRILVPVSIGTANEQRILAEMKAEASGLRAETILHVHELEKRVVKRLLMSGYHVNAGLYYASASFRGIIDGGKWDSTKNQIVVNFQPGADLREAMKQTTVNIIGEKADAMYIAGVQDASTRAQDSSATPGRAFTLRGARIKIAGTDASVGITLTSEGGDVTRITEDLIVRNMPSEVIFLIPSDMAKGTYTLRLTTQYANAGRTLKSVKYVEQTVYVGTKPSTGDTTGGGDSGSSGGQTENPLG